MKSGSKSYHNGLAAEDIALRLYEVVGGKLLAKRWKTREGEIDLVVDLCGVIVFVEVKSSRNMETALAALGAAQQARLMACAEQYLAQHADLNTECRFDLVAVDGQGMADMVENILQG